MSSSEAPARPRWGRVFGLSRPLSRRHYFTAGLLLVPFKYLVEVVAIHRLTGNSYSLVDFFNPLLSSREYFTADAPLWLGMAWIVWSLPFLWLAVTLSIRRALDAGLSPWLGFLMLAPLINFLLVLGLSLVPSGYFERQSFEAESERIYAPPLELPERELLERPQVSAVGAAAAGLSAGAAYLIATVVLMVYAFGSYGSALFFGAPMVTGAVAGYLYNRPEVRPLGATLGHAACTLLVACCAFLLVGLEGVVCIVMAAPIMLPLGLFGAVIGRSIAEGVQRSGRSEVRGLLGCSLLLPLLGMTEGRVRPEPTLAVESSIVIAAPVETVWANVIDFSPIAAEPAWYFKAGIAYPTQAAIEGSGVGAIRYCEFTTGTFVEPITVWEPPRRLAFDVSEQPEPMFELTPYRHIHPPHLDGSFRSLRGEFRLDPVGRDRTLLVGTTWYQLDIHPLSYWTVWTDWLLHRIHFRVLEHIRDEAEAQSRLADASVSSSLVTRELISE